MAEAILRGVIRSDFLPPESIVVSDPLPAQREVMASDLGVAASRRRCRPGCLPANFAGGRARR